MTDFDEGQEVTNSEHEKQLATELVRKDLENFPYTIPE